MENQIKLMRYLFSIVLLSSTQMLYAHAGPVDRYIEMMHAQTTIAHVVTLIVFAIIVFNKFCLTVNKSIIRTALISYSVTWIMVGLWLFNSWPLFLATFFAPIYIYPVVKHLNVYKKTNPQKSSYRFIINLGFTLIGTIMLWVFMPAFAVTCKFLCAYLIPDVLYYRDIRDDIYNATSFDINYISGLIMIHATWMFMKWLEQYHKKEEHLKEKPKLTINNIIDKFRSISFERISNYLMREDI